MTMNCDRAAELLPWLLNGTLEAGERRELLEHLRGCPTCRSALAGTRTAWDLFDWHPEPAALIALAGAGAGVAITQASAGTGGAGATAAGSPAAAPGLDAGGSDDFAAIEEHLGTCPSCAAELELLRMSRRLAEPAEDERIVVLPAARRAKEAPAELAPGAPRPGRTAPIELGRAETAAPWAARPAARDDLAARRAWQRSALAAGLVGLLAASGWLESARHSRDLERRLAAAGGPSAATRPATAPPPSGAAPAPAAASASEAGLRRRAGEAESRLAALANQNQQLQRRVAELGRVAAALDQRAAAAQRQPPAPAARIESDAWVGDLSPAGQAERGAGEPAPEVIPLSAGAATVILHARLAEAFGDFELEVRDAQDRPVGRPVRLQRQPGGQGAAELAVTLRRNALAPGSYTFKLFGRAAAPGNAGGAAAAPGGAGGPERKALATYSVRIS
jgi:Putative zinc-finger